ncbi:MAG: CHRD domain-containing protein [Phycisphaeraceae bacterium]|nr:CHRD domain-containing protein [Phycisphaeraceae bacterium]
MRILHACGIAVLVMSTAVSTVRAATLYFTAVLEGSQEVPPNGSTATGSALVTLNTATNALNWHIAWSGLSATAAHFHGPATPGVNAGVQVNIGTANPNIGSASLSAVQAQQLIDGLWYINVHTAAFPGGEIRGQCNAAPAGFGFRINEIRIDEPSTDNSEYFEILGPASTPLTALHYLVIGDGSSGLASGVIEAVVPLGAMSTDAGGLVAVAESTMAVPGGPNIVILPGTNPLNFENNDNVTHLLVFGFTGTDGQDLDLDDDGVLDVTPWSAVLDAVGMVLQMPPVSTEWAYGASLGFEDVGPDGVFVPGHIYRCGTAGAWTIGPFDPLTGDDTPALDNPDCAPEPTGACCLSDGSCMEVSENDCVIGLGGSYVGTGVACAEAGCVPACPADFNGSGDVEFGDLLIMLSVWGPCPGCDEDLDGSGTVDFADLLILLSVWGPC